MRYNGSVIQIYTVMTTKRTVLRERRDLGMIYLESMSCNSRSMRYVLCCTFGTILVTAAAAADSDDNPAANSKFK